MKGVRNTPNGLVIRHFCPGQLYTQRSSTFCHCKGKLLEPTPYLVSHLVPHVASLVTPALLMSSGHYSVLSTPFSVGCRGAETWHPAALQDLNV